MCFSGALPTEDQLSWPGEKGGQTEVCRQPTGLRHCVSWQAYGETQCEWSDLDCWIQSLRLCDSWDNIKVECCDTRWCPWNSSNQDLMPALGFLEVVQNSPFLEAWYDRFSLVSWFAQHNLNKQLNLSYYLWYRTSCDTVMSHDVGEISCQVSSKKCFCDCDGYCLKNENLTSIRQAYWRRWWLETSFQVYDLWLLLFQTFFEGVEARVAQGVKREEVSYQLAFSKTEVRKVIKEYPGKEVKKGLEHLKKKVEKHLCDEENLFQVNISLCFQLTEWNNNNNNNQWRLLSCNTCIASIRLATVDYMTQTLSQHRQ